jgi:uncharacterized protein (DUF1501 family)
MAHRNDVSLEHTGRLGADRRAFMLGAAAGALALPSLASASLLGSQERKTKHVVLVAFAGGVRTRETFGTPGNVPTLEALAKDGVLYKRVKSSNLGHFGAALSIFTGISEARGIRENARGGDPTLFEYVRKDGGLSASEVWISTSGGAQQTNYSYGLHPDYGARYGANTVDGDGLFNAEFKSILDAWGRPKSLPQREAELLGRMRGAIGGGASGAGDDSARVEKYILDELTSGTADIRGANAADAKAIRVARNLLVLFKPRLVSIVLQQADAAHGSYNGYVEIIRRNDEALGDLWRAVRADPELRDSTAFVILPEFGRDADLNSRRGLDHGDGSNDLEYVTATCWGPDFARNRIIEDDVQAIDVCPTVCELLGASATKARGKRLPRLYA